MQRAGPDEVHGLRDAPLRHRHGPVTTLGNALAARAERRGAETIVAVSAATARGNGVEPDGRRVVVVPNFVDDGQPHDALGSTSPALADDIAALSARLPDGDFLLFVGDLRPMKGVDVLLAAYAALATAMPLVLIGKRWPDTPTALPEGVEVHERWPNAAVMEAFRRSAIAVVPSIWAEPFGIVVIEAMAGGAAVVASRVGGIPEIIEDGVSGVLVAPGDVDALAEALRALIDDPARRAEMGVAARLRSEDFACDRVVPVVEAVYRSAMTRR